MFEEFLKDWDFTKSVDKYTQFLNFISYKYNLKFDTLTEDLKDFVKSEKEKLSTTNVLIKVSIFHRISFFAKICWEHFFKLIYIRIK